MSEQDDENPSEPAPDETVTGAGASSGWNAWVRHTFSSERFFKPAPSNRRSPAGTASSEPGQSRSAAMRAAVNNLDDRERRLGIFALAFELVLTGIIVGPYLVHHHTQSSSALKTLSAVHLFLIEGLVVAAFLLIGTLTKRRAFLGFAAMATGIWLVELPSLRLFGLGYLALGMWLLFRGLKSQQKAAQGAGRTATRQPRPAKSPRAKNKAAPDGRSAPQPSKRYTPPKAPRRSAPKKPTPARDEPSKR